MLSIIGLKYTGPSVSREAERAGALTPRASLTNVAYKEAAMATIEVIFSPPLAQSKPTRHALPLSSTPAGAPSNFRNRRDAR